MSADSIDGRRVVISALSRIRQFSSIAFVWRKWQRSISAISTPCRKIQIRLRVRMRVQLDSKRHRRLSNQVRVHLCSIRRFNDLPFGVQLRRRRMRCRRAKIMISKYILYLSSVCHRSLTLVVSLSCDVRCCSRCRRRIASF